jgi:hypothetical protein
MASHDPLGHSWRDDLSKLILRWRLPPVTLRLGAGDDVYLKGAKKRVYPRNLRLAGKDPETVPIFYHQSNCVVRLLPRSIPVSPRANELLNL